MFHKIFLDITPGSTMTWTTHTYESSIDEYGEFVSNNKVFTYMKKRSIIK